jgi:hypothetical protein
MFRLEAEPEPAEIGYCELIVMHETPLFAEFDEFDF